MQTVVDKVGLDYLEEVPIKGSVNEEVYNFFDAIPDLIDVDVSEFRQLKKTEVAATRRT